MPELSPAVQAVLDALCLEELNGPQQLMARAHAAAALRAAATKLRDAYANEEYVDPADDWLDDIAAELEAP